MLVIHDGSVIDSFSELIVGAAAHDVEYLKTVRKGIDALNLPVERGVDEIAEPGRGGFGVVNKRTGLIVTPTAKKLRHYRTVHFADPSASALNVGFVLIGMEKADGIGFMGIGAVTDMEVNEVMGIARTIHELAVLPAIQHIADLTQGGSRRGGFFGT